MLCFVLGKNEVHVGNDKRNPKPSFTQITMFPQLCFLSKIYVCRSALHSTNFCIYKISNYIEVHEEPVPQTKRFLHCVVKFEASEENRITYKGIYTDINNKICRAK